MNQQALGFATLCAFAAITAAGCDGAAPAAVTQAEGKADDLAAEIKALSGFDPRPGSYHVRRRLSFHEPLVRGRGRG